MQNENDDDYDKNGLHEFWFIDNCIKNLGFQHKCQKYIPEIFITNLKYFKFLIENSGMLFQQENNKRQCS